MSRFNWSCTVLVVALCCVGRELTVAFFEAWLVFRRFSIGWRRNCLSDAFCDMIDDRNTHDEQREEKSSSIFSFFRHSRGIDVVRREILFYYWISTRISCLNQRRRDEWRGKTVFTNFSVHFLHRTTGVPAVSLLMSRTDREIETKAHSSIRFLNETLQYNANEPSLAFYRIQVNRCERSLDSSRTDFICRNTHWRPCQRWYNEATN